MKKSITILALITIALVLSLLVVNSQYNLTVYSHINNINFCGLFEISTGVKNLCNVSGGLTLLYLVVTIASIIYNRKTNKHTF